MPDICELCYSDALEIVYTPERSLRGIAVHICANCGLVQSLPRADSAPRTAPAVSSGADWGNVRYGKGFRSKIAVDAVLRHRNQADSFSLLDVGSNRGRFARALLDEAPNATIVAVEPDERVAQSCAGLERTELLVSRIEDTALESGRFDIVHSCHTIEHLAHPERVLDDHWRCLKDGGLLVLDAPNIALIGADDIVEEWFIDKHLYHFSERTLTRMVEAAGFSLVERPDPADRENLFLVAKKSTRADGAIAGVGGIIVFLPQIMILFFVMGLLESTGYMARAAVLMDRIMGRVLAENIESFSARGGSAFGGNYRV